MIEQGWNIIKTATEWYFSNGYIWVLFLIAVIFSVLFSKNKNCLYLTWYTIIYSVCVLNPCSAIVLSKLGMDGVYWRCFWMLPIGCIIAYMFTDIATKISKNVIKGIMVIASVAVIIFSGKQIYTTENFQLAENIYKIPEKVIDVYEYMESGDTVFAPADVIVWLRTYTSDIYLPVGRQEYYFGGNEEKIELISQMSGEEPLNVGYVAELALKYGCNCIVVNKNQVMDGDWRAYNYTLVGETDEYLVYRR